MERIERILACSARAFGLAWPLGAQRHETTPPGLAAAAGIDPAALECCAAEGAAPERLVRERCHGTVIVGL